MARQLDFEDGNNIIPPDRQDKILPLRHKDTEENQMRENLELELRNRISHGVYIAALKLNLFNYFSLCLCGESCLL